MQINVADAIVSQLAAGGIERIYGVIGDAVFPLAAALERQRAVRFVPTTHEAHAAYMASYEAKLTGRPAACMATSGPGSTNLATGLADAFFDGAPVIAITGQVESSKIGTGQAQHFDQQAFFQPITASTHTAFSGEAALHALLTALEKATNRSTATHVCLPKDVFEQPVAWSPVKVATAIPSPSPRVIGDKQEAIQRLNNSRRPLLLIGSSQRETVEEALELAEAVGAAVIVAQQAKGAVPFDHHRLIGGIGEAHVPEIVNEGDLLILIGDAPYELAFIPKDIASIVVHTAHRGVTNHPLLAEWIGNVPDSLRQLRTALGQLQRIPRKRDTDDAWQQALRDTRRLLDEQIQELLAAPTESAVNPYLLALQLSDHIAEDAVITVDTGAFSHWFDLGFRVKRQTILTSSNWRSIGFALPAAIAAQIAKPQAQVVAITGDGALLQSMSELTTAVRFKLPIVLIIVNNATYDIERQKMTAEGFGDLGTDLPTPDYVAYAEALGATGLRVTDPNQLDAVIEQGLRKVESGPVVIDVKTVAAALPHPIATG